MALQVDNAAAADCEKEVDTFLAAKFNAFMHEAEAWIRNYSAELHICDGCLIEHVLDLLEKA